MRKAECGEKPFATVRAVWAGLTHDLDARAWGRALGEAVGQLTGPLHPVACPAATAPEWATAFSAVYNRRLERAKMTGFRIAGAVDLPVTTLQEYRFGRSGCRFYRFLLLAVLFGVRPATLRREVAAALRGGGEYPAVRTAQVVRALKQARAGSDRLSFADLFAVADATGVTLNELGDRVTAEFQSIQERARK